MPKQLDNVGMTVSGTPGTGNVTLGSAITDAANGDYQTFASAGAAVGDPLTVRFVDGNAWEESDVLYASGPSLTGRTLIKSSTGSLLSLTSSAVVFSVLVARDFLPAQLSAQANLGAI